MSLKQAIKNNLTTIYGIHKFIEFVKMRFIIPNRRRSFGYFGATTELNTPAIIKNPSNVFLYEDIRIREGLHVINHTGKFIVKKFSVIAADCTVVTGNHTPTVSVPQYVGGVSHINDNEKGCIVEEGVWIGTRCTLLSGSHIGRGAVIGACSLVNKEIPPYAVAVGSPAKVIASVFTLEQILEHERFLYPEEERLSRDYLEELFATHFVGKKSIGLSTMKNEDILKVQHAAGMMHHNIKVRAINKN